jgi:hypothetical protein
MEQLELYLRVGGESGVIRVKQLRAGKDARYAGGES